MELVVGCVGTLCQGVQGYNSKRGGCAGVSWQGDAQVHLAGGGDTDDTSRGCMCVACGEGVTQLKLAGGCTSPGDAQVKFPGEAQLHPAEVAARVSPGRGRHR